MVRMLVRYFPDKMWLRGNMDRWGKNSICFAHIYQFLRAAPSWYDGISTFHVGGKSDLFTFRKGQLLILLMKYIIIPLYSFFDHPLQQAMTESTSTPLTGLRGTILRWAFTIQKMSSLLISVDNRWIMKDCFPWTTMPLLRLLRLWKKSWTSWPHRQPSQH